MQLNKDPSILFQRSKKETSFVSVYIDNFLLVSNIIALLKGLKEYLAKEYNIKDLKKVKTMIK